MTKKNTLKWRLGKLPTSDEVINLVSNKVITEEEAREILFSSSEEDSENLKSEIKFLRELISKLSDRNTIVEKIRYIDKPYIVQPWYQPYYYWYNGAGINAGGVAMTNAVYQSNSLAGSQYGSGTALVSGTANSSLAASSSGQNFTDIKTF